MKNNSFIFENKKMTSITIQQLTTKLRKLPEKVYDEVDKFLDFLNYKAEKQKQIDSLTDEQKQELHRIKEAFEQVELIKQGKIKTRPAKEFLDEL